MESDSDEEDVKNKQSKRRKISNEESDKED